MEFRCDNVSGNQAEYWSYGEIKSEPSQTEFSSGHFKKNALQSNILLCITASESQPLFSPCFIDFSKDRPEQFDIM